MSSYNKHFKCHENNETLLQNISMLLVRVRQNQIAISQFLFRFLRGVWPYLKVNNNGVSCQKLLFLAYYHLMKPFHATKSVLVFVSNQSSVCFMLEMKKLYPDTTNSHCCQPLLGSGVLNWVHISVTQS